MGACRILYASTSQDHVSSNWQLVAGQSTPPPFPSSSFEYLGHSMLLIPKDPFTYGVINSNRTPFITLICLLGQLDATQLGGLHVDPFSESTKRAFTPTRLILPERMVKIG